MIYKLVDDYDYTITGILITDKSKDEVQNLIDEARNEDDGYWDTIMRSFKENAINFIRIEDVEKVEY